jgi:hypothetical protein
VCTAQHPFDSLVLSCSFWRVSSHLLECVEPMERSCCEAAVAAAERSLRLCSSPTRRKASASSSRSKQCVLARASCITQAWLVLWFRTLLLAYNWSPQCVLQCVCLWLLILLAATLQEPCRSPFRLLQSAARTTPGSCKTRHRPALL